MQWNYIHISSDQRSGPRFNIKMTSYWYRKSHCGDKTILRPSYLQNGISYTGKTTSLYWIGALTWSKQQDEPCFSACTSYMTAICMYIKNRSSPFFVENSRLNWNELCRVVWRTRTLLLWDPTVFAAIYLDTVPWWACLLWRGPGPHAEHLWLRPLPHSCSRLPRCLTQTTKT